MSERAIIEAMVEERRTKVRKLDAEVKAKQARLSDETKELKVLEEVLVALQGAGNTTPPAGIRASVERAVALVEEVHFSVREVVARMDMPKEVLEKNRGNISVYLKEMADDGRLVVVLPGDGRRPTTYRRPSPRPSPRPNPQPPNQEDEF